MTAASTTGPGDGSVDPDGPAPNGTTTEGPDDGAASDPSAPPHDPAAPGWAAPGASEQSASSDNRFLLWLRSLDLARRPGWIGGVCAGIAERLGIDPLIVRGVLVVVAVLGGPALLFYAAAWLLLPDDEGVLPIEQLLRGHLDRVHAGIGVLVLASMLPVAQGFWSLGGAYTGATPWAPATGRALWTAVVLALVVAFVIWIARRAGRADRAPGPDAPPAQGPAPTATGAEEGAPLLPPQRPTDTRPSSPEDLAVWRERQEAWKAEREAFRAQQSATARETARERAEEARLRAQAITAGRLERRRLHREANPRLRPSATLLALGAAALAGALASLTASGSTATVVGFSVASLVLGLAIVIAGLLRRRAALLIAVSVVTVLTASTASLVPPDRQLLPVLGWYQLSNATPGSYAMAAGDLQVSIDPALGGAGGSIDVWQGAGDVSITAVEGAAFRLEATTAGGYVWLATARADGDVSSDPEGVTYDRGGTHWTQTFGDPDAEPFVVRVEQGRGSISVYDATQPDGGGTGGTQSGSAETDSPQPDTAQTGSATDDGTTQTEAGR